MHVLDKSILPTSQAVKQAQYQFFTRIIEAKSSHESVSQNGIEYRSCAISESLVVHDDPI